MKKLKVSAAAGEIRPKLKEAFDASYKQGQQQKRAEGRNARGNCGSRNDARHAQASVQQ